MYTKPTKMDYYLIEQYRDNIAVNHIFSNRKDAEQGLKDMQDNHPDLELWIEESPCEPKCVNM